MNKAAFCHFRREFTKRGAFAARLDAVLFAALSVVLSYSWFLRRVRNYASALVLALILAAVVVAVFAFVQRIRFERFVKRREAELRREAVLTCITVLSIGGIADLLIKSDPALADAADVTVTGTGFFAVSTGGKKTYCAVFLKHPDEYVGASELLAVSREAVSFAADALRVYSTAALCETAKATAHALPLPVEIVPQNTLIAMCDSAGVLPDEEHIERFVEAKLKARSDRRAELKQGAFTRAAARRYTVAGTVILAASILVRSAAYYRIIAAFCFALALACLFVNRERTEKKAGQS